MEGNIPPHFHCTCPPVGESQVYGPSLSPADIVQQEHVEVAAGCTTGIHEVATLFSHTQDPCLKWEELGEEGKLYKHNVDNVSSNPYIIAKAYEGQCASAHYPPIPPSSKLADAYEYVWC